jgi:hypothetical protein
VLCEGLRDKSELCQSEDCASEVKEESNGESLGDRMVKNGVR